MTQRERFLDRIVHACGDTLHKKQVDKEHGLEMHKFVKIKVSQNQRKRGVLEDLEII